VCASNVKQPTKKAFHFPGPSATRRDVPDPQEKTAAAKPVRRDVKTAKKAESAREDGFKMPDSDHAKLVALKRRCADAGLQVSKTELLRAGVAMLEVASLQRLLAAVENLEPADPSHPARIASK
jgi:hypothetical protein